MFLHQTKNQNIPELGQGGEAQQQFMRNFEKEPEELKRY